MFMAAPFAKGPAGEEAIKQLAARMPRPAAGGASEDIAAATAFLCSDRRRLHHRPGHWREQGVIYT